MNLAEESKLQNNDDFQFDDEKSKHNTSLDLPFEHSRSATSITENMMTEIDDELDQFENKYKPGLVGDIQLRIKSQFEDENGHLSSNSSTIDVKARTVSNNFLTEEDYYSGVMLKQQPVFPKLWQNRFFVLDTGVLSYYKTQ